MVLVCRRSSLLEMNSPPPERFGNNSGAQRDYVPANACRRSAAVGWACNMAWHSEREDCNHAAERTRSGM
eukprot:3287039-Amphidinium_carterae.1